MTDIEKTVIKAIELEKRLTVIYEGKDGITERKIKPISCENGELYAYCYLRGARRKFKLEHILSAEAEYKG